MGAPFYFDRLKEEGGAVYIFMNENGSFQKTATMFLTGPTGSGFGFALAAIGDINQDGFQGMYMNLFVTFYTHLLTEHPTSVMSLLCFLYTASIQAAGSVF